MNALQPFFPSRYALFWIEAIYAIPFLGQMQGVSSRYPPGPTPRMRESLRFRQARLAAPELLGTKTKSVIVPIAAFLKFGIRIRIKHQNRKVRTGYLNELRRDSGPTRGHFATTLFRVRLRSWSQTTLRI